MALRIRSLLQPPNAQDASNDAVFYLNNALKSFDDIHALEDALRQAEQRDEELRTKLAISQADIDKLISETRQAAIAHTNTAQDLSLQRHSLADELSYLSSQLTSSFSDGEDCPTLLEDIETLHRDLKELESVKGYVQIIEHALKLSESACAQVRSIPAVAPLSQSAVTGYKTLQDFVASTSATCENVEDGMGKQTLNLVTFLERIRDKCWSDIKGVLTNTFLAASEKLGWPMPVNYIAATADDRKAFEKAFVDLLRLQSFGESLRRPRNAKERSEKDGLYPLQALIQPISMRFKYHFEGTRETNRIDKPEWYFSHLQNVMHEHRAFMDAVIQPLLSSTDYRAIIAWREFTLLLFPLLSRKLRRSMPSLLPHPPLLAHTIYQALLFDAAVREEHFTLAGTSASSSGKSEDGDKWDGTSDIILGNDEWFSAWMEGEKQFAESQYNDIVSAIDAWQIAPDEAEEEGSPQDLRSTTSARRLKALVEQVTDRYSPLPQFAHRTRFLINVQIPLLENYYGRLLSSLDAFETLSSAFVRAVPGALAVSLGGRDEGSVRVDGRRLTAGVEGVQRLCKAWLSSRYMEAAMEGWGEELFFLELWTEISRRAALRVQAQAALSLPEPRSASAPQETVFEELISLYRKMIERAEEMIVQQVCGEIESGLKAHLSATTSSNSNHPPSLDGVTLSQTLLGPISLLSTHLAYLRSTLPQATTTTVYRRIATRLSEHILQRQILYRGQISRLEGKAVHAECELWVETCQTALGGALGGGRARVERPWVKLLQAGRLLGLDGDSWLRARDGIFDARAADDWEQMMHDLTGVSELPLEEAQRVFRNVIE